MIKTLIFLGLQLTLKYLLLLIVYVIVAFFFFFLLLLLLLLGYYKTFFNLFKKTVRDNCEYQ